MLDKINQLRGMQGIDVKYVRKVDFSSLKNMFRSVTANEPTKIIEITNVPSISKFADEASFLELYNRTDAMFVIILKLDTPEIDDDFLEKLDNGISKLTILQITTKYQQQLFFKTSEKFRKVCMDESLIGELLRNENDQKPFDFETLCNLLHFRSDFGCFNEDFLSTKLNTLESTNELKFVDWAIQHRDWLSLQFIQLFVPAVNVHNETVRHTIELCANHGLLQTFKILLEDSGCTADTSSETTAERMENFMSLSTPLKTQILEFLLQCGVASLLLKHGDDIVHDDEILMYYYDFTIMDVVWKSHDWELIIKLLEANAAFPSKAFDHQMEPNGRLSRMIAARIDFHENVISNNLEAVEKFVDENPKIKCAYDIFNQSALSAALQARSYDVYAFLRSQGFSTGIDGDHDCILEKYSIYEKEELKLSNRKFFHTNDNSHIMELLSKSRLCFGSSQRHFKKIQEWYETLDFIAEVQAIMRLIAASKKIDVVFDFNRETIDDMDPTQISDQFLVHGRTIYSAGNIMIGAKGDDEKILALIAHEFTHYAMHLVYEHHGKPFHASDDERKMELDVVIEKSKAINENFGNRVISGVFYYSELCYAEEIIVRVPELKALHIGEPVLLAEITEKFEGLFEFFEQRTLPDVVRKIPEMIENDKLMARKHRENETFLESTRKQIFDQCQFFSVVLMVACFLLNYVMLSLYSYPEFSNKDFLNSVPDLSPRKICCFNSTSEFESFVSHGNVFIRTETPEIVVKHLVKTTDNFKTAFAKEFGLQGVEASFAFIKTSEFFYFKNRHRILQAFHSSLKPKMIIFQDDDRAINATQFYNLLHELKLNSRIILIAESDFRLDNFKSFAINFELGDLTEGSQRSILNKSFKLHGNEVFLKDIIKIENCDISLKVIIKLTGFVIESENLTLPSYFIERRAYASDMYIEDIVRYLNDSKTVVLADDAGWGKSTYATYVAIEYQTRVPLSWTTFVELKLFTKAFTRDGDEDSIEINSWFFSQKILNFKRELEHSLFEKYYKDQNVMFIFDGFDEISPNYKTFILKMLSAVKVSGNRMLITTRTYLADELVAKLKANSIKLGALRFYEQQDILVGIWMKASENVNVTELLDEASHLLYKLRENLPATSPNGDREIFPLQLVMLAEAKIDSDDDTWEIDMFSLYKVYVTGKIDIWNRKGPLAIQDNTKLQLSAFNILQIHEKIAVEYFFADKSNSKHSLNRSIDDDIDIESLSFPVISDPLSVELILRIGLIKKSQDGNFLFIHQSFAEFFVAEFLVTNMVTKTQLTSNGSVYAMFMKILAGLQYHNIRKFVDDRLKSSDSAFEKKMFTKNLNKNILLLQSYNASLYWPVAHSRKTLSNAFLFIIQSTVDVKTKIELLKMRSGDNLSITTTQLATNKIETFRVLWRCIDDDADAFEKKTLLLDQDFKNVFGWAVENDNEDVVRYVLNISRNIMTSDEFFEFVTRNVEFHYNFELCAKIAEIPVINLIWKVVDYRKFGDDFKKRLLLEIDVEHRTGFLYSFSKNPKSLLQALAEISRLLTKAELKAFLENKLWLHNLLFHYAKHAKFEVLTIFWHFIEENLDERDQKLVLLRVDQPKYEKISYNVLAQSITNYDDLSTKFMLEVAQKLLEREIFVEYLAAAEWVRGNSKIFKQFRNFTRGGITKAKYNLLQFLAMNSLAFQSFYYHLHRLVDEKGLPLRRCDPDTDPLRVLCCIS